jgi:hypothetical protein
MSAHDHLGFDSVEDKQRFEQEQDALARHYNDLLYRVFVTEDGKELLEQLKGQVLMLPIASAGVDLFSMGKVEGRNEFVRSIIQTIEQKETTDA